MTCLGSFPVRGFDVPFPTLRCRLFSQLAALFRRAIAHRCFAADRLRVAVFGVRFQKPDQHCIDMGIVLFRFGLRSPNHLSVDAPQHVAGHTPLSLASTCPETLRASRNQWQVNFKGSIWFHSTSFPLCKSCLSIRPVLACCATIHTAQTSTNGQNSYPQLLSTCAGTGVSTAMAKVGRPRKDSPPPDLIGWALAGLEQEIAA